VEQSANWELITQDQPYASEIKQNS